MPAKNLTSPLDRTGAQKLFSFGGGANTITVTDVLGEGGYFINSGGGDDTVTGSSFDDTLIGGAGSDVIIGGLGDDVIYGGEDAAGTDSAKGRDAVLTSALVGDVEFSTGMTADFTGGADHVFGSDGGINDIYGDVKLVGYSSTLGASVTFTGGDDELIGGDSDGTTAATNTMRGDANSVNFSGFVSGEAFVGGADTMTGGSGAGTVNTMYGEAFTVSGEGAFTGGGDDMTGGDGAANNIYGDAARAVSITSATGGDDTLHGGAGAGTVNNMYGDFNVVENSNITGGNDMIFAGGAGATDNMYGDWDPTPGINDPLGSGVKTGGADTFVIGMDGGMDTIFDFRGSGSDGDQVDLSAFADLTFETLNWDDSGTSIAINFAEADTLIFDGIADNSGFVAEDFIFAVA